MNTKATCCYRVRFTVASILHQLVLFSWQLHKRSERRSEGSHPSAYFGNVVLQLFHGNHVFLTDAYFVFLLFFLFFSLQLFLQGQVSSCAALPACFLLLPSDLCPGRNCLPLLTFIHFISSTNNNNSANHTATAARKTL